MTNSGISQDLLARIRERVAYRFDPKNDPAEFIRDVHKQWKEEGGKIGGKPRHSDRCLEEFLREQRTLVRSLTPKLIGKTNIQPGDASALIRVFLTQWPAPGASEEDFTYEPFLSEEEICTIASYVEERIASGDAPSPNVSQQDPSPPSLPGEDIGELIARYFEEADALITVSTQNTLINLPKTELIGFRNLMNAFWAIERRDNKPRELIWVLDYGDQIFEDYETRRKYLNVQALISRFKALKRFEDRGAEKRWQWLVSRAAIVLLDTVQSSPETPIGGRNHLSRPPFLVHNISLTSLGEPWLSAPEFRTLYGKNLDQLDQRSFSVFFNATSKWSSPKRWRETADLRYFGYASFAEKDGMAGRGLELPPLPYRNAEGFRAVAMAAAHALKLKLQSAEDLISGEEATGQLQYLGFRVLNLEEFLEKY